MMTALDVPDAALVDRDGPATTPRRSVIEPRYRLAPFQEGLNVAGFDCGQPDYNAWLTYSSARAPESGSARVYVLEKRGDAELVVGYFAFCPTLVVGETKPKRIRRGLLASTPGWLLAKLALGTSLRCDPQQWDRLLLREALERGPDLWMFVKVATVRAHLTGVPAD